MRSYDLSNLKVLAIDGSQHFLSITRTMVQAFGVREIRTANSLKLGQTILKDNLFDLALIDLVVGNQDGMALVRSVRLDEDHPNRRMPFIVVTAIDDRAKIERALATGVDYVILKPLDSEVLYRRITVLVDAPQHYVASKHYFGPDRRAGQSGRSPAVPPAREVL